MANPNKSNVSSNTATTSGPKAAFFYGTLMAPQVLHRVCHGNMSKNNPIYTTFSLTTTPALLHNHRRHRVKEADYPGLLPTPNTTTRGTYVSGLTEADIWRLDIFEGSEYTRQIVKVHLLNPQTGEETGEVKECETYIWTSDPNDLEGQEWDFAEFQREKMRFWVGAEGEGEYAGRPSIIEVDEAVAAANQNDGTRGRGANGHITKALDDETKRKAV